MKLTPHDTIETMFRTRKWAFWDLDDKALEGIACFLSDAALFDFGDLSPSREHKDFGFDLYERGMLRLPYPVTGFLYRTEDQKGDKHPKLMVVHQLDDKKFDVAMCGALSMKSADGHNLICGGIPLCMTLDFCFSKSPGGEIFSSGIMHHTIRDDINEMNFGKDWVKEQRLMMAGGMAECVGYLAMLMSKGIETKYEPAPAKLNKARIARKKPPIKDRYVVTINFGTNVRRDHENGAHERASPRPHWRRGHFRTYERDGGEARTIPIPPTLVAVRDDSPVAKPVYQAKK